jgi:hypothetical protein
VPKAITTVSVCSRRRFWQCPNGKECKYRHKLPPGFKLKSEIKELLATEAANKPSLEEEIEAQRQAVEARTPITEQARFLCSDAADVVRCMPHSRRLMANSLKRRVCS